MTKDELKDRIIKLQDDLIFKQDIIQGRDKIIKLHTESNQILKDTLVLKEETIRVLKETNKLLKG